MCPQRRPLLTPQGAVRAAGWATARINASSLGSCASGIRAGVPAPQVHGLPPILVSVGPDFSRVGWLLVGGHRCSPGESHPLRALVALAPASKAGSGLGPGACGEGLPGLGSAPAQSPRAFPGWRPQTAPSWSRGEVAPAPRLRPSLSLCPSLCPSLCLPLSVHCGL